MARAKRTSKKKKMKKVDVAGVVHIKSTFNNTIITITDQKGNVVSWASPGSMGFKGSRKSTPFAATRAAEQVAQKAKKMGMQTIEVRIRGTGSGRESAVTALQHAGLKITAVEDRTPIPHNGCRPRKKRRV